MDTEAHISDLTSVSFPDFETKSSQENNCGSKSNELGTSSDACYFSNYENYGQPKHDHDITLDLSLGQKSENIFATDQTPTPTRLIKNCDEVGLFEDLRHVNPFDIGFQRAVEQNGASSVATVPATPTTTDGDLHTPQVYPLDNENQAKTDANSPLDVPNVEALLATTQATRTEAASLDASPHITAAGQTIQQAAPLQLFQPQMITWVLPAQAVSATAVTVEPTPARMNKTLTSAIPIQTVRPFILPKPKGITTPLTTSAAVPTTASKPLPAIFVPSTPQPHEPSSASLTPTSQLPIKERLKAILNSNSNRNRESTYVAAKTKLPKSKGAPTRTEDCMERRRAAASRYRNKMRNEHAQLRVENRKLRERIAELEQALKNSINNNSNKCNTGVVPHQIQIPPSSIHLVINVPKMVVSSSVQQQPETQPQQNHRLIENPCGASSS
ncbi:cyclic AMP-dependent transcription factor ATF-2 [Scaptodrosophila lebanonensis]|uniref:Cyclic AMP-dependent transcription factor ATF-2 n=1 Tax=Drosophila lebanonensis TaxID=7225 RepID=A0A6J2T0N7_DROLE|nr:cyclic AMP-dependent transcription factor ATF-2 [Scaptodrosophila lebanonensis]